MLAPASVGNASRPGLPPGNSNEDVGAQVGEQAGDRVGVAGRQVEDPHGIEQPVRHPLTVPARPVGVRASMVPGQKPSGTTRLNT